RRGVRARPRALHRRRSSPRRERRARPHRTARPRRIGRDARRRVPARSGADSSVQPRGERSGRPFGRCVSARGARALRREAGHADACAARRDRDVRRRRLVHADAEADAAGVRSDWFARREHPAGAAARAGAEDRRRPYRQADRVRRRRARHGRARAARERREGRGGVLVVPGQRGRPDGGVGRRRDHAAEVHLVRAEAARWPPESPHMKVLVADKFEKSGLDGLTGAGCDVVYQPDLAGDALTDAIKTTAADVLVVRGTQVTAAMLEAGALSLVVRAGAGYNTIDTATASTRGIYVSNCPGKNAVAVAELAFALILALDRRVPDNVAELRAGTWNKKEYSKAKGLLGRTIGLIGYGNIGQEVARRAHAFGMPIVVWSRRFATGRANVADEPVPMQLAASPADLAARSDIVSIHVALSADTRGLVDAAVIDRLKPGAYVINTARAEVVDYAALEAAARDKNVRVGLDVYPGEPAGGTGEFRFPLASVPGVYGTHHIGASTDQAQEAIAA